MLGCIPLLHRILFFGGAMRPGCQVTSVVHTKETTFTKKRTDNEERNEIGVLLSDSND